MLTTRGEGESLGLGGKKTGGGGENVIWEGGLA